MNIHGTIRLKTISGKKIASAVYCSREDRQYIMLQWFDLYGSFRGYYFIIRPSIDHAASVKLGEQYPQLKYNGTN